MKTEQHTRAEMIQSAQQSYYWSTVSDATLDDLVNKAHPHITENLLRIVYRNRKAYFIQFIRHILGIEIIASFPDTVAEAFDQFIAEHTHLNSRQLEFLRLLKDFIIQREKVEIDEILQFTEKLAA